MRRLACRILALAVTLALVAVAPLGAQEQPGKAKPGGRARRRRCR